MYTERTAHTTTRSGGLRPSSRSADRFPIHTTGCNFKCFSSHFVGSVMHRNTTTENKKHTLPDLTGRREKQNKPTDKILRIRPAELIKMGS